LRRRTDRDGSVFEVCAAVSLLDLVDAGHHKGFDGEALIARMGDQSERFRAAGGAPIARDVTELYLETILVTFVSTLQDTHIAPPHASALVVEIYHIMTAALLQLRVDSPHVPFPHRLSFPLSRHTV
jgi:hypothetical protein